MQSSLFLVWFPVSCCEPGLLLSLLVFAFTTSLRMKEKAYEIFCSPFETDEQIVEGNKTELGSSESGVDGKLVQKKLTSFDSCYK